MIRPTVFLLALVALMLLTACSPDPVMEGRVRFIQYQVDGGDIRFISADPAPVQARQARAALDRYDADPYARCWPGYIELTYTRPTSEGKTERVTHVIPRESLQLLRWRTPSD